MMPPNGGASETDIGRLGPSGTHYYAGAIDEVKVYPGPRTSQDILGDFQNMGGP
jgi:hypothetical protein